MGNPLPSRCLAMRQAGLVLAVLLLAAPAAAQPAMSDVFEAGASALQRGAFDTAVARFTEALRAAEASGDRGRQVRALIHIAEARAALGQYLQAIDVLQDALRRAQQAGERAPQALIGARLGDALVVTGAPEAAATVLEESLRAARQAGDG